MSAAASLAPTTNSSIDNVIATPMAIAARVEPIFGPNQPESIGMDHPHGKAVAWRVALQKARCTAALTNTTSHTSSLSLVLISPNSASCGRSCEGCMIPLLR